jgi:hypothetical protein
LGSLIAELNRRDQIERDLVAAKQRIEDAARALVRIPDHSERLRAVLAVYTRPHAPRQALADSVGISTYHVRYLLKAEGNRPCAECGARVPVTYSNHQRRELYCECCEAALKERWRHARDHE